MPNKTMQAVGFYKYFPIEHPESLLDITLNKPVAAGSDLLVRVKAVSVNPVDVIVRAPKDTVEDKPKVIGWDVEPINANTMRRAHAIVESGSSIGKVVVEDFQS